MAEVRYALIKGEEPALKPVHRPCERGGFLLNIGEGGPTGRLEHPDLDGSDLFGVVRVARDLAALVEHELKQLRDSGTQIFRVHVGETWDPFLGPLEVQAPVLEAVEAIAGAGVDVQLRTRAALSRSIVERLAEHRSRIRVEMPFVSMRPDISMVWEPGAATPGERLRCTRSLTSREVRVAGRVDPLLPLINDTQADIEEFCVAFAGTGMHRATVAYLQLTPERARAMARNLSRMHRDILKGCFVGRPWQVDEHERSFKRLPPEMRERGLKRFLETAQKQGLAVSVCGCSDGDVLAGSCHNLPVGTVRRRQVPDAEPEQAAQDGQLDFFGNRLLATR